MIRRTTSGAHHLAAFLAHWAGGHTVSDEELLRRIVKARSEAHEEAVDDHRRGVRKALKTVEKLTRRSEEDGGLTPSDKAKIKAAKADAQRHAQALAGLGAFTVPHLDPGQIRHRRQRIATARCALLAAPAAGIVTLSATAAWWAAPAAATVAALGAWARGPHPLPRTVRPVPAGLIADTPLVLPNPVSAPVGAVNPVVPAMPVLPPGVGFAATSGPVLSQGQGHGGEGGEPDPTKLIEALSTAFAACRVIPRGRRVTLLARPEVSDRHWSTLIRLPDETGATVDQVTAHRKAIAGELGLDRARFHIESVVGADEKTLRVSGFDVDPFAHPVPCTPDMLADVDVWERGIPVAVDAFGRLLYLRLKDVSILLGGSSRSGKGAILRLIIAGCLLDARVRLHLADGKHPGQHRWKGLADTYIYNPDTRAKELKNRLGKLVKDMGTRAARLAAEGVESLAERPGLVGTPGLELDVVVIDEVSVFTGHRKHGRAITCHLADLAARGLAFGIILVLSTQLATGAVLDRLITANIVWRWCMYATGAEESNTILGKGAAGRGWSAHLLDQSQRGTGILLREGQFTTVRSLWLDGTDMATVLDMVRALRTYGPATVPLPPPEVPTMDWSVVESWLTEAAPQPSSVQPAAEDDPKARALELIRQAGPEGIKRAQVADAVGTPATTVSGWLKTWIDQGLIQALGSQPHTRYVATDDRQ